MIHKTKDLSTDQKIVIEGLLGRTVSDEEAISIRSVSAGSAPVWLKDSWNSAGLAGLSQISPEEIEMEIAAARSNRRSRHQPPA